MTLDKEEEEKKILTEPGDSLKIICLGDSAVGKSKLVERFLMDGYKPQQLSTYALTLFKYETKLDGQKITVEDPTATQRSYALAKRYNLPVYYVSAAKGTNVVKLFRDSIKLGLTYKKNSTDYMDQVLEELANFDNLVVQFSDEDSETENANGDGHALAKKTTNNTGT